ncbi:MAG: hypothetical protein LC116_09625 [Bacteroidetes bacterium]|nr:hypothetical protein [Bacteroidota bacterium]
MRFLSFGLITSIFATFSIAYVAAADNDIQRAMKDELVRSMDKLSVESLQRPYYMDYRLTLRKARSIKSTLGSLLYSRNNRSALLTVGVRVGSPEFDNTNFFDVGLGFFGSADDEETFRGRRLTFEPDYASLRRELWLASDAAYKQSAEIYAKKESAVKNRLRTDTTPDFKLLPPAEIEDTVSIPDFDVSHFEQLSNDLSAVFLRYPRVSASAVSIEYLPKTVYFVNSEGRGFHKNEFYAGIEAVASSQAADGMPLAETYSCYTRDPRNFPSRDSLLHAVEAIAKTLNALLDAPTLPEAYSGPILFEEQAAAELFAQVFAPNLVTQRPPLTERGIQDQERYFAFQNKIGGRVLPEFLSLTAEPDRATFGQTYVLGNYSTDDDGIAAQRVTLVYQGYLKTLLSSRIPTKRIRQSNGHQRGGAAMISTLILSSESKKQADRAGLKKRMMKLCKDRELPFGIIIRKALNQNILYTSLYEQTAGEYPFAQGETKMSVLETVKLYPDGREELIRGVEAAGLTPQSFKDIILVGKKQFCYNYLAPAVTSPFISGGDQYTGATIIVPDILFEDGELRPLESDFPKPPFIVSPLGEK